MSRWSARTAAALAGLLIAAAVVAGCTAPLGAAGEVGTGSCRGFFSQGSLLGDRALLDRAVTTWRQAPTAPISTQVFPPRGPVCVVEAAVVGGRSSVTMVGDEAFATYTESVDGVPGVLSAAGRLPQSTPVALPALPLGGGRWRLASSVTAAAAYVGAPRVAPTIDQLDPARSVPVQQLITDFATAHPTAAPHLLLLVRTPTGILALTGGGAYAPDLGSVFAVALATATEGGLEQAWDGYQALASQPSYVPLMAQSVGFAPTGRQEPQRVSRQMSVVGEATAPRAGPVLVVSQEPDDGSHGQPAVISLAQRSGGGADVQVVGTVLSPTGAWSAGYWLDPVVSGAPDPRELVVMGRPEVLGERPLALTVDVGGTSDTVTGPVAVVTGGTSTSRSTSRNRPAYTVVGVDRDGTTMLSLAPPRS